MWGYKCSLLVEHLANTHEFLCSMSRTENENFKFKLFWKFHFMLNLSKQNN